MKPIWICSLLAALLCSVSAGARAADGALNFQGSVVNATCVYGGTNGKSQTVSLPGVAAANLNVAGATAGETPFEIVLSGCSSLYQKVAVFFGGINHEFQSGRFANTAVTNAATNVSLQLLDGGGGTPINSWQISSPAQVGPAGDATIAMRVRYFAEGPVTVGQVTSAVNVWIVYP